MHGNGVHWKLNKDRPRTEQERSGMEWEWNKLAGGFDAGGTRVGRGSSVMERGNNVDGARMERGKNVDQDFIKQGPTSYHLKLPDLSAFPPSVSCVLGP